MPSSLYSLGIPDQDLDHIVAAVGPRWERLRNKRLLLTGGTGFIGKWLLASFLHANKTLRLNSSITMLSRRAEAFVSEFSGLRNVDEILWLDGDVRTLKPGAVADCDFAVHAATDVAATSTPDEIFDTCATGTRSVLEAMKPVTKARRLLLLSSGAVYGRAATKSWPILENCPYAPDPLEPGSAYGEGKRVSELLCSMAAALTPGLEVSIARCFAFVGPHLPFDKHFAIGNFIEAAMRGHDINILGDGTPLRSYLYASDLAHWLWVMLFDAKNGKAYNIGGSEALSIAELAYRVNDVLGGTGNVRIAQSPRPGAEAQAYIPSIDCIAAQLGVAPTVGLNDAILRTARWAGHLK
jgi:nucleoside-diphosphate-sugar epimerase